MCDRDQLNRILAAIARYSRDAFGDKLEAVILYGSYARGDYTPESDIDVMVLVDMDREALMQYRREYAELTSRLSLEDDDCTTISLLLESRDHLNRWLSAIPFYQNVMREGVEVVA